MIKVSAEANSTAISSLIIHRLRGIRWHFFFTGGQTLQQRKVRRQITGSPLSFQYFQQRVACFLLPCGKFYT